MLWYVSCKEELIMILINQIITDIRIESVNDLYKLKPFLEDGTLKINKSQIMLRNQFHGKDKFKIPDRKSVV